MLQVPGHHNYLGSLQLVPSHGLCLIDIEYDQKDLDKFIIKYEISPDGNMVIPLNEKET